jgi:cytochrome c553
MLVLLFALVGISTAQTTNFTRDVEPVLKKRCVGCHGAAMQQNGLRLDDGESALKGGYSGAAILAGKSAQSPLIERISSTEKGKMMPPGGARLSAAEIAAISKWIDDGAKWPLSAKAKSAPAKTAHWAFQPIARFAIPTVQNRAWVRNPIDAFVLARLESEGIAPSPEANKATLIRRLKLDLTGLPPTPSEVAEFLSDNRPDAYEQLVDKFIASPHYGEKWARQWLDLARYADSDGYEKDQIRPMAWRWRQWVIDALNKDMPFDQFTIEQLAGDMLPGATIEQRVATGFQRNTLTNREAGVDREETRFEQIVNRTNTVGTVWLGLTVGCAQCHDHKFDPISQREYYQLFSFFNTADDDTIDAPMPGEMGPYLRAKADYDRNRSDLLAQYGVADLMARWETHMRRAINDAGKDLEFDFSLTSMRAMFDHAKRILMTEPAKRRPIDQDRLTRYFISSIGPEFGRDKALSAKMKELREKLAKLDASFPNVTQAMVMLPQDPDHEKTYIKVRGDWKTNGIEVQPGTLAVMPAMPKGQPANRLAFAEWLVSRENPLTARVFVNRAWQELFGKGIVGTSEDFGKTGEPPSHPQLLDWLASSFQDQRYSMKQLHKTIVMSATYRQSSKSRPELKDRDPDNSLLARQSRLRLSAEQIRDSALWAGGILDTRVGGKSVRPPMPAGVAELSYGGSKWKESEGMDRYRRGLYIHFQRTTPYPQLMTFDAPDSNTTCSRRRPSNTPLQALNLLNDPVFAEAYDGIAVRALHEAQGGFRERLDYLFELTLSRPPSATERERLDKYFDQQTGLLRKEGKSAAAIEQQAWASTGRVLMNLDEFINRE